MESKNGCIYNKSIKKKRRKIYKVNSKKSIRGGNA
jgi:hypothetical protein